MPLLIIDGPEKAGKTTLCGILAIMFGYKRRHWGPVTHDSDFLPLLKEDIKAAAAGANIAWDRSWAADAVYGQLMGPIKHPSQRLAGDPWLGEWLYTRGVRQVGVPVILTGPEPSVLASRRDSTDLPVDPELEQRMFREHGEEFGWAIESAATERAAFRLHAVARAALANARHAMAAPPPAFAGPAAASTVVIGESRNVTSAFKGSWLPFTTPMTAMYGRAIGATGLRCLWTNVADVGDWRPYVWQRIVACGMVASEWARRCAPNCERLDVLHPAALLRWGANNGKRDAAISALVNFTRMEEGTNGEKD